MSGIRVLIATTRGPSAVQRITPEDPEVKSVVCLDGKAMPLPISAAYEHFVRSPTGVVERLVGHGAFRMDVEQPIDDGASWQLGALVAHALAAEGQLAGKEQAPGRLVWCTGEVDHDLRVRTVAHVGDKLWNSQAEVRDAVERNIPVLILLPRANAGDPAPAWLGPLVADEAVRVVPVESALEACRLAGAETVGPAPQPRSEGAAGRSLSSRFLVFSLLLLLAVGGLAVWTLWRATHRTDTSAAIQPPEPAPPAAVPGASGGLVPASTAAPLDLGIGELRMPTDGDCPDSLDGLVAQPVALSTRGRFASSKLDGLCGLEFTIGSRGGPAHLWAFAQMVPERVFLLADTRALHESATVERRRWRVALPPGRTRPLSYVFVALASPGPLAEVVALLPKQFDWNGGEGFSTEFKALSDDLNGRGVTVVVAAHDAVP